MSVNKRQIVLIVLLLSLGLFYLYQRDAGSDAETSYQDLQEAFAERLCQEALEIADSGSICLLQGTNDGAGIDAILETRWEQFRNSFIRQGEEVQLLDIRLDEEAFPAGAAFRKNMEAATGGETIGCIIDLSGYGNTLGWQYPLGPPAPPAVCLVDEHIWSAARPKFDGLKRRMIVQYETPKYSSDPKTPINFETYYRVIKK